MKHIQKLICVLSVFLSAFLMSGCAEQSKKARIGIIGALDEEVAALKDALTEKKHSHWRCGILRRKARGERCRNRTLRHGESECRHLHRTYWSR